MSAKTGISWTDATWNPVVGCEKVSQGCKFCYAKTLHDMRHRAVLAGKDLPAQYAEPFERVQLMPDRLGMPLKWRAPRRVFVNSVSDLFHGDVPDDFIDNVFAAMALASHHTFQILTKRPLRMRNYVATAEARVRLAMGFPDWLPGSWPFKRVMDMWPLPNVWLGVSVENQAAADERIPLLLQTPAAIRFLSCEPLLGAVNLNGYVSLNRKCFNSAGYTPGIDWVIVGGESGNAKQDVRQMHAEWVRSLRDQCTSARTSFHFKQFGDYLDGERVGTKRAGRILDGRTWDEFPASVVSPGVAEGETP